MVLQHPNLKDSWILGETMDDISLFWAWGGGKLVCEIINKYTSNAKNTDSTEETS